MPHFNIGIDTGGTYTDAVVLNMQQQQVVATAKELTTYDDLAIGVTRALDSVLSSTGHHTGTTDIELVSLSTTLATNALVEGNRAPVGVMLIGFNDAMAQRTLIQSAMPEASVFRIDGGHRYTGTESSPLDEQAIRDAFKKSGARLDAYAVASHYAVRNTEHEKRAAGIIEDLTGQPVTLSCELSDALDGPRRALTAAFNASIVSRIVALIRAVKTAMQTHQIQAPLMVVKGDGSLASAVEVATRPIETILSGPAASVIGARYLSGLDDFAVADVGGTTTDIAVAHNGWPRLTKKGSTVGEFRTLVKAIDMQTVALGGDSEVNVDFQGRMTLGPRRLVPVALLGSRWPVIQEHMRAALLDGKGLRRAGRFVLLSQQANNAEKYGDLNTEEQKLLELISDTPAPLATVALRASDEARLDRLIRRGLVHLSGFTPSDAAHRLGLQHQWCSVSAALASEVAGRSSGLVSSSGADGERQVAEFAQSVFDQVVQESTHLMAEQLCGKPLDEKDPLIAAVTSGRGRLNHLGVSFSPDLPVVGVGGPASIIYPKVGERLGADVVIPEFSEVANAIGAAIGMVKTKASVEITQRDDGGFQIHRAEQLQLAQDGEQALALAEDYVCAEARSRCEAMGAEHLNVNLSVHRVDLPDMDRANSLVAATVTAECTGTPAVVSSALQQISQ